MRHVINDPLSYIIITVILLWIRLSEGITEAVRNGLLDEHFFSRSPNKDLRSSEKTQTEIGYEIKLVSI